MKVVAVYSTKGGVGKTTTAVNLAWEAARTQRVLLWDLDPQGASTFLFEVKPKLRKGANALVTGKTDPADVIRGTSFPALDLIPADASYRDLDLALDAARNSISRVGKIVASFRKEYDLVILDCPPGESLVAKNALDAADLVLLPLTPSPLARRSLDQVRQLMGETGSSAVTIPFLSMVDRRKSIHLDALEARQADGIAGVAIPAASVVERMGAQRAPVGAFAPRSPAAVAFADLFTLVTAALGPKAKKTR